MQGELAELDARLNNKSNSVSKPFKVQSKASLLEPRNPKFDFTGISDTTATTMARTRELKKNDIFPQKDFDDQIKRTKTDKPPVKDEWDLNFFDKKKKKKKGKFLDRFSKAIKKEKQVFKPDGENKFEDNKKKQKQQKLRNKMAKTMDRGKLSNDDVVVGQKDIAKNIQMELEAEDAEFEQLFECPICGRSFKRSVLQKHIAICKKVFQTKRKEFETKDKRILTNEQKILAQKGERKMKLEKNLKKRNTKKKWKKQSEGLRNMIKRKAKQKGTKKEVEIELVV